MNELGKIKSVIIDNELNNVKLLCDLIRKYYPRIEIIGIADSVDTGINYIEEYTPDLVFMDIAMSDGTGFSIIEDSKSKGFEVVVVTADDNYAIRAFDFSVIHYILKPIDSFHLTEVMNRYYQKKNIGQFEDRICMLQHNLQKQKGSIMISTLKEFNVIKVEEIIYCKSSNNYTTFYLDNGDKFIASKPLNSYYALLDDCDFYRIHSSIMINLRFIRSYVKGRCGYVVMTNGAELDVSQRKRNQFLHILDDYMIGIR